MLLMEKSHVTELMVKRNHTMTSKQIEARVGEWLLFKPLGIVAPFFHTNYSLDGQTITVKRPFRRIISVRFDELDEVGVETTDQGPFVEDVFLILKRGKMRIRIGDPHPAFRCSWTGLVP